MKNIIKSLLRTISSHVYYISTRTEWDNFKKNTINSLYRMALQVGWSSKLTNEKLLTALSKLSTPPPR